MAVFLLSLGVLMGAPEASTIAVMPVYADTVESGFLFVDGKYVPTPYMVIEADSAVFVNGVQLDCEFPWMPAGESLGASIGIALERNAVLVANSGEAYVSIRGGAEIQRFLRAATSAEPLQRVKAAEFSALNPEEWTRWWAEYSPPADFHARANVHLSRLRKVRKATSTTVDNRRSNASMAYPLTILGMLAGVWSLGHLLTSAPQTGRPDVLPASSPEIVRATKYSILAVGVLSVLDLVWTLMASRAGLMKELNPLGSALMSDPNHLVAFKLVATGIGCVLLFAFRTHQRARKAAWWLCLVLTLLTFRWLVFGSMQLST